MTNGRGNNNVSRALVARGLAGRMVRNRAKNATAAFSPWFQFFAPYPLRARALLLCDASH